MLPTTFTLPDSFSSSPSTDEIRDDFPDPTVPTTWKTKSCQSGNATKLGVISSYGCQRSSFNSHIDILQDSGTVRIPPEIAILDDNRILFLGIVCHCFFILFSLWGEGRSLTFVNSFMLHHSSPWPWPRSIVKKNIILTSSNTNKYSEYWLHSERAS